MRIRSGQQVVDFIYRMMRDKKVSRVKIGKEIGITGTHTNQSLRVEREIKKIGKYIDRLIEISKIVEIPLQDVLFEKSVSISHSKNSIVGDGNKISAPENEIRDFLSLPPQEREQIIEFLKLKQHGGNT